MHPNVEVLRRFYDAYGKADVAGMLAACGENVTFQLAGKSKLAGKYDRASFPRLIDAMKTLGGGTLKADIHDITATDQHGMVLMTSTVTRDGKKHEYRAVHVWRIQGGKPIAWYEYPRDLYQFDAIWS